MFLIPLKAFIYTNDVRSCTFYDFYDLIELQDEGLDDIAEGLHALKNMAHDMNEVCILTNLLLKIKRRPAGGLRAKYIELCCFTMIIFAGSR